MALLHADALAQTQWHEPAHAVVAQNMLETLAEDPSAAPARIVTAAARALPAAAGFLTAGSAGAQEDPAKAAAFLVEELAIGDAEDAVASLRAQLSDPSRMPAEEYDMLFEMVANMQKDLVRRKAAHK